MFPSIQLQGRTFHGVSLLLQFPESCSLPTKFFNEFEAMEWALSVESFKYKLTMKKGSPSFFFCLSFDAHLNAMHTHRFKDNSVHDLFEHWT
ncbi:hypothetical protein NC652_027757 [Populus alba x Populus x berolinensis]|nr:hypothetical protein NC652_027757 [Populus alba x Populus x berolinensis]